MQGLTPFTMSEGLGSTASKALCELAAIVPKLVPLRAGMNPNVCLDLETQTLAR
jgi:hypothetical protein